MSNRLWIDSTIHTALDQEFERAYQKHKGRTPRSHAVGDGETLAILVEEVGEVARALTYDEGSEEKLGVELIQLATMAAAWAERIFVRGDHPGGVPIYLEDDNFPYVSAPPEEAA